MNKTLKFNEADLTGQKAPAFNLHKLAIAQERFASVFIDAFSGASGGVLAALLFYPLENLRIRLQAGKFSDRKNEESKSSWQVLQEIIKDEGFSNFYRGLNMALIGTVASYGSYFFCYRLWKNLLTRVLKLKDHQLTPLHITFITFLSGSTSSVFANPFWMVNTRMTTEKEKVKQKMVEVVKKIY